MTFSIDIHNSIFNNDNNNLSLLVFSERPKHLIISSGGGSKYIPNKIITRAAGSLLDADFFSDLCGYS